MNHIGFIIAIIRNTDIGKGYIWKNQVKTILIKIDCFKASHLNVAIRMKVFGNSSCNRV